MRRKKRTAAEPLRRAVDRLPERSRRAMLQAVDADTIIAGAYTSPNGGMCPMLAAHRRGGRTDLASFATAWDRYTGAKRARRATPRELRALRAMLEASLMAEEAVETDLSRAVAEVKRDRTVRAEADAAAAVEAEAEQTRRSAPDPGSVSVNPAAEARRAMARRQEVEAAAETEADEIAPQAPLAPTEKRRPTGEVDRTPELSRRAGWAWTRPVRRLDAYEAAVERAERQAADEREPSSV